MQSQDATFRNAVNLISERRSLIAWKLFSKSSLAGFSSCGYQKCGRGMWQVEVMSSSWPGQTDQTRPVKTMLGFQVVLRLGFSGLALWGRRAEDRNGFEKWSHPARSRAEDEIDIGSCRSWLVWLLDLASWFIFVWRDLLIHLLRILESKMSGSRSFAVLGWT